MEKIRYPGLLKSILSYVFVSVFAIPGFKVNGQDGHLLCPGNSLWYTGDTVTLNCEVSKQSIQTLCTSTQDRTEFRITSTTSTSSCTVDASGYANCLASDPATPPGPCWCQENSTDYKFVYQFTATKGAHDGSWTCQKGCFDSSTVHNPLGITQDSSCANVFVTDRTTTTTTRTSTTQTTTPPPPPPPPCWCVFLNPNNCARCQWICILLIVVGILLLCVGTAVVICLFVRKKERRVFIDPGGKLDKAQLTQCAQSLIDMESEGYGTKLKNIEKQATSCCTCCPVSTEVDGKYSINMTNGIQIMEHDQALHVLVTCRNYIYLRRAVKMVKALITELVKYTNRSLEKGDGHETAPASKIRSNAVHPAKYTGSSETNQTNDVKDGDSTGAGFNTALGNSRTAGDGDSQHSASTPRPRLEALKDPPKPPTADGTKGSVAFRTTQNSEPLGAIKPSA